MECCPELHYSWCTTYSLVSRVTMMRMGRRFMPPTQLLLHMKLYKTVVNSVPTWRRQRWWAEEKVDGKLCFFQAGLQLDQNEIGPHYKASLKEMKSPCSQGMRRVFHSSFLTEGKKGFIAMRMGKTQDPNSFHQGYNPHLSEHQDATSPSSQHTWGGS